MKENHVRITSKLRETSFRIHLDGQTYLVDSEDQGIKHAAILTRVYHKGEIIYSHKFSYKKMLHNPDLKKEISEIMARQREIAIEALKIEKTAQNVPYKKYIKEVESLIDENMLERALQVLNDAEALYPNNPVIFSYQGYLDTMVNKQYSKGVKTCEHAIKVLSEEMPLGKEFFLPTLYLNLGKVYLAANRKKDAYESFKRGLEIDKNNEALFSELKALGIRKKAPVSFLNRSNLLNRYLGKLLHSKQK